MVAPIATQKDQLWSADGLGFPTGYYFASKAGGDVKAETTKVFDGGKTTPDILFQQTTTDDITLTGLYRAADHQAILATLKTRCGRLTATLKHLDCDADKVPIGAITTYAGALLTGVKVPEHDSNSTSESKFELVFSLPA